MFSPARVVLPVLVAASFLLQGCSTTSTSSSESKCPFAKLVQKDATNTPTNQETPAKTDSQQQAR